MNIFKKKEKVQTVVNEIKVDLTPDLKIMLGVIDKKFEVIENRLKKLEEQYDRLPQTEKPSEIIVPRIGDDGKKVYYNSKGEAVTK